MKQVCQWFTCLFIHLFAIPFQWNVVLCPWERVVCLVTSKYDFTKSYSRMSVEMTFSVSPLTKTPKTRKFLPLVSLFFNFIPSLASENRQNEKVGGLEVDQCIKTITCLSEVGCGNMNDCFQLFSTFMGCHYCVGNYHQSTQQMCPNI